MSQRCIDMESLLVKLASNGYHRPDVATDAGFDVLVIGSGASGPRRRRRPPSGRARASRSRRRARSSRATPRRRRAGSRPPSARTTRPSSTRRTSGRARTRRRTCELVEVLTSRGAVGDPLARGARRRVHARERRLPARPLRRRVARSGCSRSATARGTRSRRRSATRSRAGSGTVFPNAPLARARADRDGWRARCRRARSSRPATVVLAAGGRCYAEAEAARRAVDEPSRRDRRGDEDRARPRRRGARPRRAPVPPERRRVAARRCRATRSRRRRARTAPSS